MVTDLGKYYMAPVFMQNHAKSLRVFQQRSGETQIKRLKRELDVLQTEYKLIDKARVKNLQVYYTCS